MLIKLTQEEKEENRKYWVKEGGTGAATGEGGGEGLGGGVWGRWGEPCSPPTIACVYARTLFSSHHYVCVSVRTLFSSHQPATVDMSWHEGVHTDRCGYVLHLHPPPPGNARIGPVKPGRARPGGRRADPAEPGEARTRGPSGRVRAGPIRAR